MNNSVKSSWFLVPKKVKQINDYIFIDTYKSNTINIGLNEMMVSDGKMSLRWNNETWSSLRNSVGPNRN